MTAKTPNTGDLAFGTVEVEVAVTTKPADSPGLRLSEMKVGSKGRVVAMSPTCSLCLRLLDYGLTPGTEFSVTKLAPFGGPIEIEVRGTRVCLRSCEADYVCIEPLTDPES